MKPTDSILPPLLKDRDDLTMARFRARGTLRRLPEDNPRFQNMVIANLKAMGYTEEEALDKLTAPKKGGRKRAPKNGPR